MAVAALGACCFLAVVTHAQSAPLQRWDLRYPLPPTLGRVLFANGVFVGLPSHGLGPPFTSTNGVQWTHATVHADTWAASFSGIDFGNDQFFGVSRAGQVFRSVDATNWTALSYTPVAANSTNRDIHIAAGNGLLVTASAEGGVTASTDGLAWSWPQTLNGCPKRLWFGNGTFLALLTCDPGGPGRLVTSPDGQAWFPVLDDLHPEILDVSFSDGLFTAVSSTYELVLSRDGLDWGGFAQIPLGATAPPTYFIYGNGRFVGLNPQAGADSVVLVSSDADHWQERASVPNANGLAYGNGRFVISGADMLTSTDGWSWVRYPGQVSALPTSVAFGAGRFVAAGGRNILVSDDGRRWETLENPGAQRLPVGVYFANGLFLGPSWPSFNPDSTAEEQGFLLTSPDGIHWTEHAGAPFLSSLRRIVYGNGRFVAIGSGSSIFTSTDGVTWAEAATLDFLTNLLFGSGLFLASSVVEIAPRVVQTVFYSSPDGLAWTPVSSFPQAAIGLSVFGEGVFVAQSLEGPRRVILTSIDGRSWREVFSGRNPGTVSAAYAGYGAGQLLILNPYRVLSSADGELWSERPADGAAMLAEESLHPAIAFGQGTFVSVTRGLIQQSAPVGPDFAVTVSADPFSAPETGSTAARFNFLREGGASADRDITVQFQLGGTARNGTDYAYVSSQVLIPAGQVSASVVVAPIPDPASEAQKTVVATVLPDASYSLGSAASATIFIQNVSLPSPIQSASLGRGEEGRLELTVVSAPGAAFAVEASTDLITWLPLTTAVSPTGLWVFQDPDPGTPSGRFYRVMPHFATAVAPVTSSVETNGASP